METDIKRINFFDGLFLRQGEFLAEQLYHLHMRRRLNYILFDGSGVVQVDPGDLLIQVVGLPADKTVRVTAGMAIGRRDDLRESREIILKEDSAGIDLRTGFGAGKQIFVAIRYRERFAELQTIAQPSLDTRVVEVPEITLHDAAAGWPPPTSPLDPDPYVLLGKIAFDTMAIDPSPRQTAKLRGTLISSVIPPPSGAPTVSPVLPSPFAGVQGANVNVTMNGLNLGGATVGISGTGIVVSGVSSTATTLTFTLAISASAATGLCTITVTNGSGAATANFQVNSSAPAPVLLTGIPNTPGTQLSPATRRTNQHFSIFGRDLGFGSATLPTVELLSPATSAVLHTFIVAGVTQRTEPGFVNFNVIDAQVGPATAITSGRVRVTTSGGSVTSTELFTILFP